MTYPVLSYSDLPFALDIHNGGGAALLAQGCRIFYKVQNWDWQFVVLYPDGKFGQSPCFTIITGAGTDGSVGTLLRIRKGLAEIDHHVAWLRKKEAEDPEYVRPLVAADHFLSRGWIEIMYDSSLLDPALSERVEEQYKAWLDKLMTPGYFSTYPATHPTVYPTDLSKPD